ncbi:hypothetical protein MMC31_007929, partial [Peltigera leucophlebia]|nr:hypothetical protein [Peltigera leucophlebia]
SCRKIHVLQALKLGECGSLELWNSFRWKIPAPEKLIPRAVLKFRISEHEKKVGLKLPNRPSAWLGKWENLIYRAKQYDEPLPNWLEDVNMVWQRVPDLHVYFKTIELNIQEENIDKHSCASISAKIQQHWERKKQSLTLRYSKPKSTQSAFATQEVTFDGEGATAPLSFTSGYEAKPDDAAKPKMDKKKRKRASRSKTLGRGRRVSSTKRQNQTRSRSPKIEGRSQSRKFEDQSCSSKSKDRKNPDKYTDPCKACGGTKHGFSSCFLVKGDDKDWLLKENRKTFDENMKIPQFKKTLDEFRRLLKSKIKGLTELIDLVKFETEKPPVPLATAYERRTISRLAKKLELDSERSLQPSAQKAYNTPTLIMIYIQQRLQISGTKKWATLDL